MATSRSLIGSLICVRRHDVAHQRLEDLDPLLAARLAQLVLELLLELELRVAADEVAGVVLAADEPREAAGVRQDDLLLEELDQLAALAVLRVDQRQLVRDDRPLDEALHLDLEAVATTGNLIASSPVISNRCERMLIGVTRFSKGLT